MNYQYVSGMFPLFYDPMKEPISKLTRSYEKLTKEKSNGRHFYMNRAMAREEKDYTYSSNQETIKNMDHYEFFIPQQMKSNNDNTDGLILVRLPKQKMWGEIILHAEGGVSFGERTHKYFLREFDKLDRQILLGFCDKYYYNLMPACFDVDGWYDNICYLIDRYRVSSHKKRINQGPTKHYRESSIFDNVVFI